MADPRVEACAFAVSDPVSHPIGEEDTSAVQDAVVVLVQSRTQDVDLDPVQIAAAVRGRMGLVATVHCVGRRPRLITRTASGKVNRTATRKRWLRSQSPHA